MQIKLIYQHFLDYKDVVTASYKSIWRDKEYNRNMLLE